MRGHFNFQIIHAFRQIDENKASIGEAGCRARRVFSVKNDGRAAQWKPCLRLDDASVERVGIGCQCYFAQVDILSGRWLNLPLQKTVGISPCLEIMDFGRYFIKNEITVASAGAVLFKLRPAA